MSLVVLPDEVIRDLLENLTREEVGGFTEALKCTLHEYSTGTRAIDLSAYQQPDRSSAYSDRNSTKTLFMPSTSPLGHGVKVMTFSSPHANASLPAIRPTGSLTLHSPDGDPIGILHARTLTAFRVALASSCLLMKRASVRTITVFGAGLLAYWHIRLALMLRGSTIRVINIINRQFSDNAKEILRKFYSVPLELKEREGWADAQLSLLTPAYGEYTRLQKENIRSADVIYCCTPSTEELFDASILTSHEGRKKGRLIVAVGSHTQYMRELPVELLTQVTRPHQPGHLHYHKHATQGGVIVVDSLKGALKEAGEIVDAGLEPNQLVELGELVMINRMVEEGEDSSLASSNVDSLSEFPDRAGITPRNSTTSPVFESEADNADPGSSKQPSHAPERDSGASTARQSGPVGFHIPAFWRRKPSTSQHSSADEKNDDHLSRWLTSGNVIFKSVGLGLMDLVVGFEIIKLANAKGVGIHV
ncbi:UbiD family decarboxylase [Xylaria nigripes]|nr:UbiD family decarboxylase [Xylaria nigripes]